jgi:hypothetical protein
MRFFCPQICYSPEPGGAGGNPISVRDLFPIVRAGIQKTCVDFYSKHGRLKEAKLVQNAASGWWIQNIGDPIVPKPPKKEGGLGFGEDREKRIWRDEILLIFIEQTLHHNNPLARIFWSIIVDEKHLDHYVEETIKKTPVDMTAYFAQGALDPNMLKPKPPSRTS